MYIAVHMGLLIFSNYNSPIEHKEVKSIWVIEPIIGSLA